MKKRKDWPVIGAIIALVGGLAVLMAFNVPDPWLTVLYNLPILLLSGYGICRGIVAMFSSRDK